jgi:CRISPR/Cas system-associated endonuclease Cas1
MHSPTKGKPSLICDSMELDRYLVDDSVVQYCRKLQKKDFVIKSEDFSTGVVLCARVAEVEANYVVVFEIYCSVVVCVPYWPQ